MVFYAAPRLHPSQCSTSSHAVPTALAALLTRRCSPPGAARSTRVPQRSYALCDSKKAQSEQSQVAARTCLSFSTAPQTPLPPPV